MKINIENYEAYLLDWMENRLDKDTAKELNDFLQKNPELISVSEKIDTVTIEPEKITFPSKAKLYHFEFEKTEITDNNFSEFCIALYENILSENKRTELFNFASTSINRKNELANFRKVYLEPEEEILFADKKLLYREKPVLKPKFIRLYPLWGAVAASIASLIILIVTRSNPDKTLLLTSGNKPVSKEVPLHQAKNKTELVQTLPIKLQTYTHQKIEPKSKNIVISEERFYDMNEIKSIQPKLISTEPTLTEVKIISQIALNRDKTSNDLNLGLPDVKFGTNDEPIERKNALLAFAESGITKINKITGSNLELSHQVDQNGKISSLSIKTGLFDYYRQRSE